MRQNDEAHRLLCFQLTAAGLGGFAREHLFASDLDRAFRWDIAYVAQRLAIEVNGGIWQKGAHGHPITILRNMEKLNWGALLGWRVLAFSTDQVKNGQALAFTEAVLQNRPLESIDAKTFLARPSRGRLQGPSPAQRSR